MNLQGIDSGVFELMNLKPIMIAGPQEDLENDLKKQRSSAVAQMTRNKKALQRGEMSQEEFNQQNGALKQETKQITTYLREIRK